MGGESMGLAAEEAVGVVKEVGRPGRRLTGSPGWNGAPGRRNRVQLGRAGAEYQKRTRTRRRIQGSVEKQKGTADTTPGAGGRS